MRPLDLALGALFAALVALAAWRAHALTRGGALAAFAVGTLTYGAGAGSTTLILLAFFVPSVALSRLGRARKRALVDVGKAGPRDALQVFANGGVATLCAVVAALGGGSPWWFAFCGAYAAATADTWGTEIGTLARGRPRSILTLRPIPAGLSGGVTPVGTLAECAAAMTIGAFALAATYVAGAQRHGLAFGFGQTLTVAQVFIAIPLIVALAGIAGAFVDSALGGSVQALRRCPACARTCETDPHVCGTPTVLVRGVAAVSNDVVNLAATLVGALVAAALGVAVGPTT